MARASADTCATEIPADYNAALTAGRKDLTTLGACAKEWIRHASPQIILVAIAATVAARIAVGGWSWRDAIVPLVVFAVQPFVEWIIHVNLLHLKPFRLFGRRFDIYAAHQHRVHHRNPSDLDRVLLKAPESLASLTAIFVGAPAATWLVVQFAGGVWLPLALTAVLFSEFGMLRYEWAHFLIHSPYVPKSTYYRTIWRNHRLHHFKHEKYWMGVSSNVGDRVLGTNPDQSTVERSETARTLGVDTNRTLG